MFGVDPFRFADGRLVGDDVVQPEVAAGDDVDVGAGAFVDDDVFQGVAAAHGDGFIDDGFQGQVLAAADLFVGGDDGDCASVDDAFLQRFGGKAAEHYRVRSTDARAGLHGDDTFDRHRHVDHDAVALLDAEGFEAVGELAHLVVQFPVGDSGDLTIVGFKDDRGLAGIAVVQVAVEAVAGHVELAILEPFVERRFGLVQRLGEGLVPVQVLACMLRPETFIVALGRSAHGIVFVHAGNVGIPGQFFRYRKHRTCLLGRFEMGHVFLLINRMIKNSVPIVGWSSA